MSNKGSCRQELVQANLKTEKSTESREETDFEDNDDTENQAVETAQLEPNVDLPVVAVVNGAIEELLDQPITTGLLDHLKKVSGGKAILKEYNNNLRNKLPLKRTTRSKLVRLTLAREKEYKLRNTGENEYLDKFVISTDRFKILADEIAHIFKGEHSATYFTAFAVNNGKSILANGKLWNHYNYMKGCLRQDNLLQERERIFLPADAEILNENEPIEDLDDEYTTWLNTHIEPWEEVIARWKLSYESRRKILSDTNFSVFDYMKNFPCLQVQAANELFTIDFQLLYPGNQLISQEEWEQIRNFLIFMIAQDANTRSVEELALIKVLSSNTTSIVQKDFLVFYLICHIIKPKNSGKRKRSENAPQKLSLQERRESFILRVETIQIFIGVNDIENKLQDMTNRYMQNKTTFQPIILAVGSATDIQQYYVVVNNKLFEVETALNAVELCLHVFFALDCNYPQSTQTIWCFIQRVLLRLELPSDVSTNYDNILIEQIRNL